MTSDFLTPVVIFVSIGGVGGGLKNISVYRYWLNPPSSEFTPISEPYCF